MQHGNRVFYWLLAVVLLGLAAGYVQFRDLGARTAEYEASKARVESQAAEVEALDAAVNQAARQVRHLDSDPVEVEATVRRIKGRVRDGEKIFHIEDVSATNGAGQP